MLHAIALGFGKCEVFTVESRGALGIGRAEIPNMEFVDNLVFRFGQGRNGVGIPTIRLGFGTVQIDQLRVAAGGGE